MLATVEITRWDARERVWVTAAIATEPVMRAMRIARDVAARNPVASTRHLTCYARPIATAVRLGTADERGETIATFDAAIEIVPSVGDLGWAP